jgi:hypothetical protein
MAKVKITAKQESVNRVSITHTTEGSELQLAFTLIATKDGFTVSGTSTLRGHVAKHDIAAYATSDGDLALVMI